VTKDSSKIGSFDMINQLFSNMNQLLIKMKSKEGLKKQLAKKAADANKEEPIPEYNGGIFKLKDRYKNSFR
jgi:hypothetical protein